MNGLAIFKKLTLSLLFLLALSPALAQDPAPAQTSTASAQPPLRTVLKALSYARATDVRALLKSIDVYVTVDDRTNVLVLRGTSDELETALKVVEALDEPWGDGWSVIIRGYVVRAREGAAGGLTPELEEALQHVQKMLPGKSFELADTLFLRAVQNGSPSRVSSPLEGGGLMSFTFARATVAPDDPPMVVLEALTFQTDQPETMISTDIQLREGQFAVVGKTSLGNGEGAMILVLDVDVLKHDSP